MFLTIRLPPPYFHYSLLTSFQTSFARTSTSHRNNVAWRRRNALAFFRAARRSSVRRRLGRHVWGLGACFDFIGSGRADRGPPELIAARIATSLGTNFGSFECAHINYPQAGRMHDHFATFSLSHRRGYTHALSFVQVDPLFPLSQVRGVLIRDGANSLAMAKP